MPLRCVGIIHKNAIITPFFLASNLKLWLYAWVLNHVMSMKFNPSHHANLNSCNPCIHQSFSSIVASSEMQRASFSPKEKHDHRFERVDGQEWK